MSDPVVNNHAVVSADRWNAQTNNQITMAGSNPAISDSNSIFYLQYVQPASGTFSIQDSGGNTIASGLGTLALPEGAELRLPGGFTLTGNIALAVGYKVRAPITNP